MIGRVSMVALAAMLLCQSAALAADEDYAAKLCETLTDNTVSYLRAGEIDRAMANKPFLEKCGPILKAKLDRELNGYFDQVTVRGVAKSR